MTWLEMSGSGAMIGIMPLTIPSVQPMTLFAWIVQAVVRFYGVVRSLTVSNSYVVPSATTSLLPPTTQTTASVPYGFHRHFPGTCAIISGKGVPFIVLL